MDRTDYINRSLPLDSTASAAPGGSGDSGDSSKKVVSIISSTVEWLLVHNPVVAAGGASRGTDSPPQLVVNAAL